MSSKRSRRIDTAIKESLEQRYRRERRFHLLGKFTMGLTVAFLAALLGAIVIRGGGAFMQTTIRLPVTFAEEAIPLDNPSQGNWTKIVRDAVRSRFPDASESWQQRQLAQLISRHADQQVRDAYYDDPTLRGRTLDMKLLATANVDLFYKGRISRDVPESERRISDFQITVLDQFRSQGRIGTTFNTLLFMDADSRTPERAGVLGSLVGSILTVMVCLFVSLPLGVMAAVYLEEFAKKSRVSDWVEININNLAAVPSIIFGLLGLALFLNWLSLPRSAPLVGGLTLAMMILPTIIISTRAALRAVPPSIRDGARALGASPVQVVAHHVLPLALPGIMTGTILGIARALGETAPLLMIGMVAFIADVPTSITDPATAMPVQIYLWADSPEAAFVDRTSACILILLAILVSLNATAAWIRKRFERKW